MLTEEQSLADWSSVLFALICLTGGCWVSPVFFNIFLPGVSSFADFVLAVVTKNDLLIALSNRQAQYPQGYKTYHSLLWLYIISVYVIDHLSLGNKSLPIFLW